MSAFKPHSELERMSSLPLLRPSVTMSPTSKAQPFPSMLSLGARVQLTGWEDKPKRSGTIAGFGSWITHTGEIVPQYIVELDEGFYSPNQDTYIRLILAHPDSCKQIC
jgi:hypothetical protein